MPDKPQRHEKPDAEQKLRWARELLASEAWENLILPELERLAREHSAACKARDLTPEKRAEHIEAAHMADHLLTFVESTQQSCRAALKRG